MEGQVVQSLLHVAPQHRLVRLYHIFPEVICFAWASLHVTDSSGTIVQTFFRRLPRIAFGSWYLETQQLPHAPCTPLFATAYILTVRISITLSTLV